MPLPLKEDTVKNGRIFIIYIPYGLWEKVAMGCAKSTNARLYTITVQHMGGGKRLDWFRFPEIGFTFQKFEKQYLKEYNTKYSVIRYFNSALKVTDKKFFFLKSDLYVS